MKKLMVLGVAVCCAGLMTGCCSMCGKDNSCASGVCAVNESGVAAAPVKEGSVDTATLMTMIRAKTPMTVLDARSGKFDDGNRIPGAKTLAADAASEKVTAMLPDKQALVVTYCANLKCPASSQLAKRLRQLGYSNVLEYHEGIEGWMAAGNSVEKAVR